MSSKQRLLRLFLDIRGRVLWIVILNIVAGVLAVVPYVAVVELSRVLIPILTGAEVDHNRAWMIVLIASVSVIVRFGFLMGAGLLSHLTDGTLQLSIRRKLIAHLRRLPLGWFDSAASGSVKKVVENDVNALHQLVAHSIQDLTLAIVVPLVSFGYLLSVDWRLALASLLPIFLVLAIFPRIKRESQARFAEYDASLVRLTNVTIEFIHGIAVVKTFGETGRSHQRYRAETSAFAKFFGDWMQTSGKYQTLIDIVTAPIVILVYLSGLSTVFVMSRMIAPVDTLPALLLGLGMAAPYHTLAMTSQYLREAYQARDSIVDLLQIPEISYTDTSQKPSSSAVEFDGLHFSYIEGHEVLSGISAQCAPNTITALVGVSGSGKSTLARLIPRFYDATSGAVRIGGSNVHDISAQDIYQEVGFVFQDPYLLRTTIRDNIRLAKPNASKTEVEAAARAAQIHDRIMALPHGYDSIIGFDANFSGGEQQRLAIARGLLTDAPVLVLDEATAFADPDSEAAIQKALSILAVGRTVIVIAHRLHTITDVDQILVLAEGQIIQKGSHQELSTTPGHYQDMWQTYENARKASHA